MMDIQVSSAARSSVPKTRVKGNTSAGRYCACVDWGRTCKVDGQVCVCVCVWGGGGGLKR